MAAIPISLSVGFSPASARELVEIWLFNANRYGAHHADSYEQFLTSEIGKLATEFDRGSVVDEFPEMRRVTIKKTARGHGHIVVYQVDQPKGTVWILHLYHTAQDIEGRLRKEYG